MAGPIIDYTKAHPAGIGALSLMCGILAGRAEACHPFILAISILTIGYIFAKSPGYLKVILFLAFVLGFILVTAHDRRTIPINDVSRFADNKRAIITGEILTTETVRKHNRRYLVEIQSVNSQPASGKVRWYVRQKQAPFPILPGDIIRITRAKLKPLRGYRNYGAWDYELYMRDRGIGAVLTMGASSEVTIIAQNARWRRFVERIKEKLRNNLSSKRDEITALSNAILLGDPGMISPFARDKFARAGVAHLLAVSGLHVGFIALACFLFVKAVSFLLIYPVRYRWASAGAPVRIAAIVSIAAVIFYAALTGPRVPSARAAIMVGVYLFALFVGRGRDFYGAFSAAIFVILAISPWALFEAGFQLSFAVVLAIVIFMERFKAPMLREGEDEIIAPLHKRIYRQTPVISSYIMLSIIAGLASAPLALFYFNTYSVYGMLINSILVPVISIAAPLGIIASTGLSETLLHISDWLMGFIWDATMWAGSLKGAAIHVGSIPAISVVFYYALLGMILINGKSDFKRTAITTISAALLLSLVWRPVMASVDNNMTVRFLDVGQGDSAIITWPGGRALSIDAGPRYRTFDLGRSIVAPQLWGAQRTTLDALIVTHSDQDHMGGAYGLADMAPPKMLMDNGFMRDETRGFSHYLKLRGEAIINGKYRRLAAGDRLIFEGGLNVEVLNPPNGALPYPRSPNNRSLVIKVTYGDVRLLFTGDIETEVERWLVDSGADIEAGILKVAHHGSSSGTSAKFIKAVGAKIAIITVGAMNRFHHPGKAVLRRLENAGVKVYRTDIDGEIVLKTDGRKMEWSVFRQTVQ